MTITVCASPGRQPASAMKVGSPIERLLEVGRLSALPIGPDQHCLPAPRPIVVVRVTLVQVYPW